VREHAGPGQTSRRSPERKNARMAGHTPPGEAAPTRKTSTVLPLAGHSIPSATFPQARGLLARTNSDQLAKVPTQTDHGRCLHLDRTGLHFFEVRPGLTYQAGSHQSILLL
jgi:hypothetical protein